MEFAHVSHRVSETEIIHSAGKPAAGLNPKSKPFTPFIGSGRSTPGTATAAAASSQQSAAATIEGAAARLTPRNPSQATQQTVPFQAQTLLASEDRRDGPGSGIAGSSAAAGESTESQVQRRLGITVHAEGLHASVTKFVEGSAKGAPGHDPGSKAEPSPSGNTLNPLQEGSIPKRSSSEVSVPPVVNGGDSAAADSFGQTTPGNGARCAVSSPALPPPVSVQSSNRRTPVQASQPPQPREQQPVAAPAKTGLRLPAEQVLQEHPEHAGGGLATGQQRQLGPPAGATPQASSAPQAAFPGHEQPPAQLLVAGLAEMSSSVQQPPPGALPGAAVQQAESLTPTVAAPKVPVRRVPLPKLPRVPKPVGASTTSPLPVSLSRCRPDVTSQFSFVQLEHARGVIIIL